jgi:hypothetical protein
MENNPQISEDEKHRYVELLEQLEEQVNAENP